MFTGISSFSNCGTMKHVHGFTLPAALAAHAASVVSAEFREWVVGLPDIVAGLAQRWSLSVGEPFQPGGQNSWVAPARDPQARDLVLKVGWRHYEAMHEADGLRVWRGAGAVLLYEADTFDQTSALLLERCVPGTALSDVASEPEQDAVLAGLFPRLWREPPPGHPFRPLQLMCAQWADEFEQDHAAAAGTIDPGLARLGMELFRTLPATAERSVLLCTDLHAENVLASERERWLVIDPKPYVGDPTYDPLQHMLCCEARLLTDPRGLAGRLADLLELDADRLTLWLFARCVQESPNRPALQEVAARLAPA
jgi:streptomycin 6-kinase